MARIYSKCDADVDAMVAKVVTRWHPDLVKAAVSVECLYVEAVPDADGNTTAALKLHGYPCAAVIRKTTTKQRVQGHADAEITIDKDQWAELSEDERIALIDHELTHLEIVLDHHGIVKTDDQFRPVLRMRLHDWELGGFREVAERHGDKALDVQAARAFQDRFGQYVFEFAAA